MFEIYEEFTEAQVKILERYVTNTKSNIFALKNLPEVIKGALFLATRDPISVCALFF